MSRTNSKNAPVENPRSAFLRSVRREVINFFFVCAFRLHFVEPAGTRGIFFCAPRLPAGSRNGSRKALRITSRQIWQRPTLPRLKTKYHRRRGVSRPSSEWDRVQPPRHNHQISGDVTSLIVRCDSASRSRPQRTELRALRRSSHMGLSRLALRSSSGGPKVRASKGRRHKCRPRGAAARKRD